MITGKIHDKNEIMFRVCLGSATAKTSSLEYEILLLNGNTPAIQSNVTKKIFSIPWSEILDQAVECGIDNDDEDLC